MLKCNKKVECNKLQRAIKLDIRNTRKYRQNKSVLKISQTTEDSPTRHVYRYVLADWTFMTYLYQIHCRFLV